MSDHSYLPDFKDNDVIMFSDTNLYKAQTLKESFINYQEEELESKLKQVVNKNGIDYLEIASTSIDHKTGEEVKKYNKWTEDGVNCEVLKSGQEWQKGKIRLRLTLEFVPDEAEKTEKSPSPLDDIRQNLT